MKKQTVCKKFRHKTAKSVLLGALIVVFIGGCGKETKDYMHTDIVLETQTQADAWQETQAISISEETQTQNEICIYICGCIKQPGVYFLKAQSRVCDALEAAGGFTEDAATDYWNQAQILSDGEMIYIPTKEEAKNQALPQMNSSNEMSKEDTQEKVNINTASKEELMKIPTVGETRAEQILAYRKEHGKFSNISDIKKVSGIKDGVFDKIKDYIVVN